MGFYRGWFSLTFSPLIVGSKVVTLKMTGEGIFISSAFSPLIVGSKVVTLLSNKVASGSTASFQSPNRRV